MDVDFVTSGVSEEDSFGFFDSNVDDGSTFEGERCGICMDMIIDRGVLDCCPHWFCFGCIDNWATITNLCPLCQNEFQLITCVPVYDTIGSNKVDDDSVPRDEDWSIEGTNNTLSFPSYYIDENAVICLDGDGCKIRNGQASIEEDSNADTSIACDSCDIWYHAFCVGFDTECTTESTWLCPRCVADKLPQKSDIEKPDNECPLQATLSGKVSVSVADDGETAVVVSLIGGNQFTEESSESLLPNIEVDKHLETETFMSSSAVNSSKAEVPLKDDTGIEPTLEARKLHLSLSCDTSHTSPHSSLLGELKTNRPNEARKESVDSDSSKNLLNDSCIEKEPRESESGMDLHLGLSAGFFLSVNKLNGGTNNQVDGDIQQQEQQINPPEDKDDKTVLDPSKCAASLVGAKRKQADCSDNVHLSTDTEGIMDRIQDHVPIKKIRGERKGQAVPIADQTRVTDSNNPKKCPGDRVVSKNDRIEHGLKKEDVSTDIMSIVQGTNHKLTKGLARRKTADSASEERENAAGLRVKKIMKRAVDDKDSTVLVEKLRKDIRDAVRNKTSKDIGENLFDPELLAAFRAAVAPKSESVKKLTPMAMKLKKSILQKGNVRENLTKKIYANSNGRRKRAWDRDCEVEFWKHRCMRYSKPEKIETLNSVLNLLRKSSDSSEIEQGSECQTTNPILSRLYLADTSVFPRKDNLEPLSVLKGSGSEGNTQLISEEKGSRPSIGSHTAEIKETSIISLKVSIPSDDRGGTNNVLSLGGNASTSSSKVHPNRRSEGPLHSSSGGLKVKGQKEASTKPDEKKVDKRKWAMEVLARKNAAAAGQNGSQKEQEDNAKLKGNYPLLAQLPVDMRPELASSRHNKIPISVRQTQLYRLTEFFLKKANLPIIRRTADTELAVADAINIEKAVADRSSSKLVYVNLCSQELKRRADNSNSMRVTESDPSASSAGPISESDLQNDNRDSKSDPTHGNEQSVDELSTDPMVIEALQAAGLDSPPTTPLRQAKIDDEEEDDPSMRIGEEGPDNVIEMDSHPELDIYGDFEYSLDDEDYIGASDIGISKLQPVETIPKLKIVFSTLDPEKVNEPSDSNEQDKVETLGSDKGIKSPKVEHGDDKTCVPIETSLAEEGEELSVAECEELYGPDKEPLIEKIPVLPAVGDNSTNHPREGGSVQGNEKKPDIGANSNSKPGDVNSISKKVEAYIKEHIRPLCKSGVITIEQYRWAVSKTTDKVMKHHCKAKNASFLIKEGEKVKKLAEQYVEASQQN